MNTENLDAGKTGDAADNAENIVVADKLAKSQTHGLGSRLRNAREAKQLSVQDVARKLFLTTTVIEQIEADNYHNVPALTFMRGYLRSYARMVGVNEDMLIREFNALNLRDRPAPMPIHSIYKNERHLARKSLKWIGVLFLASVVLAVVIWVHTEFSETEAIITTANSSELTVTTTGSAATSNTVTAPLTPNVTVLNVANGSADDKEKLNDADAQVTKNKKPGQKQAQMSSPF
jgi:cytoskeletal protein RodZ